jgi:hypothetical protein
MAISLSTLYFFAFDLNNKLNRLSQTCEFDRSMRPKKLVTNQKAFRYPGAFFKLPG